MEKVHFLLDKIKE